MKFKVSKKVKKHWFNEKPIYTYSLVSEKGETLSELTVEEEERWEKRRYFKEYEDKKILYLYSFYTSSRYRNKGYGTYLLKDIIRRFKGKYDYIHLNACPYRLINKRAYTKVIYSPPKNGLNKHRLFEFYKSYGFKLYGITKEEWGIMIMKTKSGD